MTAADLIAWRRRCGFRSWATAATALGLSRATLDRYRAGRWPIPLTVALACRAAEADRLGSPVARDRHAPPFG